MPAALFKHSSGQLIAFGANMDTRKASKMICWSDPTTGNWQGGASGYMMTGKLLPEPEIMQEDKAGNVIAWQEGLCIQMIRSAGTWHVTLLDPYIAPATNYTRRER